MDKIISNWYLIVAIFAVLISVISCIHNFIIMPKRDKIEKVKEWLLYAIVKAEKELGSGTGEIKLRYVYNMFLEQFPDIAKFLSFETFSAYVDEALEKVEEMLLRNDYLVEYIED